MSFSIIRCLTSSVRIAEDSDDFSTAEFEGGEPCSPPSCKDSLPPLSDNRILRLLKSPRTKNRFLMLRPPEECALNQESEEVLDLPDGLKGLTCSCFGDCFSEMNAIISNLYSWEVAEPGYIECEIEKLKFQMIAKIEEITAGLKDGSIRFIGMSPDDFKACFLERFMKEGVDRRELDARPGWPVFSVVGAVEAGLMDAGTVDITPCREVPEDMVLEPFVYRFANGMTEEQAAELGAIEFMNALLEDLVSVLSEPIAVSKCGKALHAEELPQEPDCIRNPLFKSPTVFQKHALQKSLAILAAVYMSTHPEFGGSVVETCLSADPAESQINPVYQKLRDLLQGFESSLGQSRDQ